MRPLASLIPIASAAVLSASISGCIEGGGGLTNFIQPDGAVLGLEIGVDGSAPVDFDLLTIRMISSAGDTLQDTLDQDGLSFSQSHMLTLDETPAVAFHPRYDVRPLSAWKVELAAFSAGNLVLSGSAASDRIARGDTLRLAVPLAPVAPLP